MPIYMVYVCHSVSDRAQLEKYWASIAPTLKGHSVKYLAAYTPFEVLEGESVEGVFVAEVQMPDLLIHDVMVPEDETCGPVSTDARAPLPPQAPWLPREWG